MNSCSLTWASYCSSALEFRPNEESAVRWFRLFFVILLIFQRKEEPNMNALSHKFTEEEMRGKKWG
jgi:hypothetical protein